MSSSPYRNISWHIPKSVACADSKEPPSSSSYPCQIGGGGGGGGNEATAWLIVSLLSILPSFLSSLSWINTQRHNNILHPWIDWQAQHIGNRASHCSPVLYCSSSIHNCCWGEGGEKVIRQAPGQFSSFSFYDMTSTSSLPSPPSSGRW